MKKQNATVQSDIGKTNKKLLVLDTQHQVSRQCYFTFGVIEDENGFPSENLAATTLWAEGKFAVMALHNESSDKRFLEDPHQMKNMRLKALSSESAR